MALRNLMTDTVATHAGSPGARLSFPLADRLIYVVQYRTSAWMRTCLWVYVIHTLHGGEFLPLNDRPFLAMGCFLFR